MHISCLVSMVVFAAAIQFSTFTDAQEGSQEGSNGSIDVAQQNETVSKKKRVCKKYTPTGTRISKRVCRSQEDWDELGRIAQGRLDKATKPQSNNRVGD